MTTININKLLLEQVQDLLYRVTRWKGENHEVLTDLHDIKEAVKAVLAAPATAPDELERKPMTDADIEAAARRSGATAYTNLFVNGPAFWFGPDALRVFVRAVEAFHDIKGTP